MLLPQVLIAFNAPRAALHGCDRSTSSIEGACARNGPLLPARRDRVWMLLDEGELSVPPAIGPLITD